MLRHPISIYDELCEFFIVGPPLASVLRVIFPISRAVPEENKRCNRCFKLPRVRVDTMAANTFRVITTLVQIPLVPGLYNLLCWPVVRETGEMSAPAMVMTPIRVGKRW